MKVFISWSGEGSASHQIALFLRDWLPLVIQAIDPYVTSEDIDKGVSWFANVSDELKSSNFGIICVTKDNIESPWIHFEAGALSNTFGHSHVCPLLINFSSSDLKGPLVQFQTTQSKKDDFFKLLKTLNSNLNQNSLNDNHLTTLFNTFWPNLEAKLKEVSTLINKGSKNVSRSDREILDEILTTSRQTANIIGDQQMTVINLPEILQELLKATQRQADVLTSVGYRIEGTFENSDKNMREILHDIYRQNQNLEKAITELANILREFKK